MNNSLMALLFLGVLFADYGGGYAGSEYRYASNARDFALAGANLADGSDGYFQFSNPAQLPQVKSIGISSSFMSLPLDRSIQTLSITKFLPPFGGIALSLYRSATSNIPGRDLMNQFTENLDVSNYMGMLSFGLAPSKKVALGLNVKTYFIQFVDNHSANGIGIDLGFRSALIDNFIFALKIENISAEMNWEMEVVDKQRQNVESLPLNLGMGFGYQNSKTKLYFQQNIISVVDGKNFYRTRIGSEIAMESIIFYLGAYQNRGEFINKINNYEKSQSFYLHLQDLVFTGGFALNMGDKWELPIKLNYGFDMGRTGEGMGHMFTINFRFNERD